MSPEDALAAVVALRRLADRMEDDAVRRACRRAGAGRRSPRRSASPSRPSTRSTRRGADVFERFTKEARAAVTRAEDEARAAGLAHDRGRAPPARRERGGGARPRRARGRAGRRVAREPRRGGRGARAAAARAQARPRSASARRPSRRWSAPCGWRWSVTTAGSPHATSCWAWWARSTGRCRGRCGAPGSTTRPSSTRGSWRRRPAS